MITDSMNKIYSFAPGCLGFLLLVFGFGFLNAKAQPIKFTEEFRLGQEYHRFFLEPNSSVDKKRYLFIDYKNYWLYYDLESLKLKGQISLAKPLVQSTLIRRSEGLYVFGLDAHNKLTVWLIDSHTELSRQIFSGDPGIEGQKIGRDDQLFFAAISNREKNSDIILAHSNKKNIFFHHLNWLALESSKSENKNLEKAEKAESNKRSDRRPVSKRQALKQRQPQVIAKKSKQNLDSKKSLFKTKKISLSLSKPLTALQAVQVSLNGFLLVFQGQLAFFNLEGKLLYSIPVTKDAQWSDFTFEKNQHSFIFQNQAKNWYRIRIPLNKPANPDFFPVELLAKSTNQKKPLYFSNGSFYQQKKDGLYRYSLNQKKQDLLVVTPSSLDQLVVENNYLIGAAQNKNQLAVYRHTQAEKVVLHGLIRLSPTIDDFILLGFRALINEKKAVYELPALTRPEVFNPITKKQKHFLSPRAITSRRFKMGPGVLFGAQNLGLVFYNSQLAKKASWQTQNPVEKIIFSNYQPDLIYTHENQDNAMSRLNIYQVANNQIASLTSWEQEELYDFGVYQKGDRLLAACGRLGLCVFGFSQNPKNISLMKRLRFDEFSAKATRVIISPLIGQVPYAYVFFEGRDKNRLAVFNLNFSWPKLVASLELQSVDAQQFSRLTFLNNAQTLAIPSEKGLLLIDLKNLPKLEVNQTLFRSEPILSADVTAAGQKLCVLTSKKEFICGMVSSNQP